MSAVQRHVHVAPCQLGVPSQDAIGDTSPATADAEAVPVPSNAAAAISGSTVNKAKRAITVPRFSARTVRAAVITFHYFCANFRNPNDLYPIGSVGPESLQRTVEPCPGNCDNRAVQAVTDRGAVTDLIVNPAGTRTARHAIA
ncbi:hypothetical protein AB0A63_28870 [Lentzea sp. NPDC042327]|uniref:hypothetical protein n=1 Tax=Lentzea sp. NPDC042327 TaxID=3154801 RepID=UPI0033D811F1